MTSGQRLLSSYVRIGGVSSDLPQSFYSAVESFLEDVPKMIKEYHGLLTGNEIPDSRRAVGLCRCAKSFTAC